MVLAGLRRQLGDSVQQKLLLTLLQLLSIYGQLNLLIPLHHAMWCAMVLSFRTLLRKSNVVPNSYPDSDQVITRRDVSFSSDGMILKIHSSKTIQHKECVLVIPVMSIPNSPFCAISLLKGHFADFPMSEDSLLLYRHTKQGIKQIYCAF